MTSLSRDKSAGAIVGETVLRMICKLVPAKRIMKGI